MNKHLILYLTIIVIVLTSCDGTKQVVNSGENTLTNKLIKYDKVESLLKEMTLEEKIGQMNQYNGFWDFTGPAPSEGDAALKYENLRKGLVGSMLNVRGVENVYKVQKIAVEETRLGIPIIFGFDVIHGYEIQSPIPLAESASWDLEAIENSAKLAAKEATAAGLNWAFAPMVDISRDPRWGRVMEGAGEDPYLGSMIAAARVKGFQGESLSDPSTLAACVKHFAAYGFAESGKDYNTADVGTSTLHNIVFPPFKAAAEAGAATFMNSFNELNGIPATGDKYIQRDVLKGEWGFEGFIVSDWGSMSEMQAHGYAKDLKHAAEIAANAGSDMDMESYGYVKHLKELVESGAVPMEHIDDSVRRILNVKYELGLFTDPYLYCDKEREKSVIASEELKHAARDIAKKSVVLLKNEGDLLPIKAGKKVAVIGPMTSEKNSPLGNWRLGAKDNSAVSLKEGLAKHEDIYWAYFDGVKLIDGPTSFVFETHLNTDDKTGMEEAVLAAKDAELVIMALGEHGYQSGEARSKSNLDLPELQQELLRKVYNVNKNIVLVNMSGRPLTLTWEHEHIPAIIQAWQLGSETGNALADVLTGDYNPSGKLPMTFPRSVGQIPVYYNRKNTGRPVERDNPELVFWSHYQDEVNDPLYCFGHGLSYTNFNYNDIKAHVTDDGKVVASVKVSNDGQYDGHEVVQLYIHDKIASVTRPIQELKGFEKIFLKRGESKIVTFELSDKELGFYDNQGKYIVEKGEYRIMIGTSSRNYVETEVNTDVVTLRK